LQKHIGSVGVHVSAFTRYNDLYFTPDPLNDLIFLGIARPSVGLKPKSLACDL
jgi:hypothetical protein